MTQKQPLPTARRGRKILMIAYPGVHNLDVIGPLEILATTTYFVPEGPAPYDVSVIAAARGPVTASSGLTVNATASFADIRADTLGIDTLMVAGGHGSSLQLANTELIDFVRDVAPRADRIVSICTGAMILAHAGLLEGKRASTHWFWCPIMEERYPSVTVESDAIYVRDGNVWTSAGVTSGMDLALALIEEDWGHDVALKVARFSVMYMMRPGGQSQFSAELIAQKAEDPAINAALAHIQTNPGDPLTVTGLAAQAAMSERTFARRFKQETGLTPAVYVETARVQAARVALETTDIPIDQVAMRTGFQNAERMRRAFHRHLGVAASDYRERFQRTRTFAPGARDGPD